MYAVTTTTEICTGNRNLPVVRGVDFVAFRSLAAGQPAVYGSGQYSTEFNDYLFFFRSEENKLIFEVCLWRCLTPLKLPNIVRTRQFTEVDPECVDLYVRYIKSDFNNHTQPNFSSREK